VAAVEVDTSGHIIALYESAPDDLDERAVIELPGGLAVPGLHDAHLHLEGIGRAAEQADLRGARSPAEVRERLQAFLADHPDVSALRGRSWDQSLFPGATFPHWRDLDGLDRPAVLTRVDGHAVWVNRAVLEQAGIGPDTPDPEGGRILRDEDGQPTGVLVDNAIDLVWDHLPRPTSADRRRWLALGAERAADAGLVAAHEMGMSVESYFALLDLDAEEGLPLRVFVYLDGSQPGAYKQLGGCGRLRSRVELRGVKLFADGAMGSRGAALLDDYSDEPGHRGLLLTDPKLLAYRASLAELAGCQVAIHAIGDRGNRVALDAIQVAQRDDPEGPGDPGDRRHRIEHAQLVHPDDFARFVELGVVASMQPTHATSDMRWAEARVGPARLEGAYAWRTMLDLEVPLAFGSDAPVEDERPSLGIHAALTRQDAEGLPPGGWLPAQRLELEEALAAFSQGAAYAVGHEGELGRLEVGHLFDVTVFDRDPRGAPPDWLEARAVATVVGGALRRR
jgi:predicted amidohydrolase YtcJ